MILFLKRWVLIIRRVWKELIKNKVKISLKGQDQELRQRHQKQIL